MFDVIFAVLHQLEFEKFGLFLPLNVISDLGVFTWAGGNYFKLVPLSEQHSLRVAATDDDAA